MSHGTGRFTPDWDSKLVLLRTQSGVACRCRKQTPAGPRSLPPRLHAKTVCGPGLIAADLLRLRQGALSRTIAESVTDGRFTQQNVAPFARPSYRVFQRDLRLTMRDRTRC